MIAERDGELQVLKDQIVQLPASPCSAISCPTCLFPLRNRRFLYLRYPQQIDIQDFEIQIQYIVMIAGFVTSASSCSPSAAPEEDSFLMCSEGP
ncbi:hypothetical protein D3C81_2000520 [compost metagenome]